VFFQHTLASHYDVALIDPWPSCAWHNDGHGCRQGDHICKEIIKLKSLIEHTWDSSGGKCYADVFIPGTCEKIYRYGIHCLWWHIPKNVPNSDGGRVSFTAAERTWDGNVWLSIRIKRENIFRIWIALLVHGPTYIIYMYVIQPCTKYLKHTCLYKRGQGGVWHCR